MILDFAPKSRGRAISMEIRVMAACARRWFDQSLSNRPVCACRTEGCLVIVCAEDDRADKIEKLLLREGLLEFVQRDHPRERRKDIHRGAVVTAQRLSTGSCIGDGKRTAAPASQLCAVGQPLQQSDVLELVEAWKQLLGMERWEIVVEWHKPLSDKDAHGEVQPWGDYETAWLKLAKGWRSWDRRYASKLIAHELLHCLFRDSDNTVASAKTLMSKDAYKMFDGAYTRDNEALVERLARILDNLAGDV